MVCRRSEEKGIKHLHHAWSLVFLRGLLTLTCLLRLLVAPAFAQTEADDRTFREDCVFFETKNLGRVSVRALEGATVVGFDVDQAQPLPNFQIAALHGESEKLHFTFTEKDGRFSLSDPDPGSYAVWTCLDGFDELELEVVIDPAAEASGLVLWVGLAEAGGRRAVELLTDVPAD